MTWLSGNFLCLARSCVELWRDWRPTADTIRFFDCQFSVVLRRAFTPESYCVHIRGSTLRAPHLGWFNPRKSSRPWSGTERSFVSNSTTFLNLNYAGSASAHEGLKLLRKICVGEQTSLKWGPKKKKQIPHFYNLVYLNFEYALCSLFWSSCIRARVCGVLLMSHIHEYVCLLRERPES